MCTEEGVIYSWKFWAICLLNSKLKITAKLKQHINQKWVQYCKVQGTNSSTLKKKLQLNVTFKSNEQNAVLLQCAMYW